MDAGSKRRRFVTARGVEDAREAGVIVLGPRDVITDEAAQRARDLGIGVRREGRPGSGVPGPAADPKTAREPKPAPPTEPTPEPTLHPTSEPMPEPTREPMPEPEPIADLREVVLAALQEELGARAMGIEQVLDAVLAREGFREEETRGLGDGPKPSSMSREV